MLKLIQLQLILQNQLAAAFARLCVETTDPDLTEEMEDAAAFARLCVET